MTAYREVELKFHVFYRTPSWSALVLEVRIPTWRPSKTLQVSVEQYLKVGQDCPLPDPFTFSTQNHPTTQRYITYAVEKASLNTVIINPHGLEV
jgi:hypothetical protein